MAPELNFRTQPLESSSSAAAFIADALEDPRIEHFTAVVAWARYRGLARLAEALDVFHSGGGQSTIVVGLDEGGATRPGLIGAQRLFTNAYVFHDPTAMTFHPKVYLAEGPTAARLLVGSSNATPGGLFTNYEASLEATFLLPDEGEEPALLDVRQFIDGLKSDPRSAHELTDDFIEELMQNPRYRIAGHERRRAPAPQQTPTGLDADDVDETETTTGQADDPRLFQSSDRSKPGAPPLSPDARAELEALETDVPDSARNPASPGGTNTRPASAPPPAVPATPATPPASPAAPATVSVLSWDKNLSSTDAQQNIGHGTRNLRLVRGNREIEWTTWFRDELFQYENWQADLDVNQNPIELAEVEFLVTIGGQSHGRVELTVSHAPHRESQQANHASVLQWGPLARVLRDTDYTGDLVEIKRLADGSYTLTIG